MRIIDMVVYTLYKNSDLSGFICQTDNLSWGINIAEKCGYYQPYITFKGTECNYYGYIQI
jgi:hypothetical protein